MSDVREPAAGGRSGRSRQDGGPGAGRAAAQDPQGFWPEGDDEPSRGRGRLIIAVVAVLVVLGAVAAFVVLGGDDEDGGAAADTTGDGGRERPTVFTPSTSDKGTEALARRTADKRPLNAGEVFTPETKTVTYKNYSFALAGSKITADCQSAAWGTRLRDNLRKHGCNQIVRGAYVSKDKKHVGQFIAINLETREGSEQIIRDLGVDSAGFVLPLTAPGVPEFGKGFSAAYAQAYGHYAVVTWVQRAGGEQPASLNEMIDASIPVEKPADFVWQRLNLVQPARSS